MTSRGCQRGPTRSTKWFNQAGRRRLRCRITSTVTVTAGSTATGNDFGDFQNITISGEKFNDLTGNGTLDAGDPGLPGWTIDLVDAFGAARREGRDRRQRQLQLQ